MKINFLQDSTLEVMGAYMTRLSKRQQVVASNIANIDTPGYQTKDIPFHAAIGEFLLGSSVTLRVEKPEHRSMREWMFAPMEAEVSEVRGLTARNDGNNVNIDKEMLKLGETSFGYSLMSQLLRTKFRTIANSINEGRMG